MDIVIKIRRKRCEYLLIHVIHLKSSLFVKEPLMNRNQTTFADYGYEGKQNKSNQISYDHL